MLADNLQKLRKTLNLGQKEFALKLGIILHTYVNYERGERKLPYDILIKLSDDFNVNLNWLIADKGEMFNKKPVQYEQVEDEFEAKVDAILKKRGII